MKPSRKFKLRIETQSILDGIRRIVRSLQQASRISEKEVGLGAAQLFVLQKISESETPLRINDLAERTLTHQSTVSVVVSKLADRRLVERLPSKEDARAVEVRLSKKGKEFIKLRPPLIQERLMLGVSLLSPSERQGLVKGLRALIEKAGLQGEEPALFFE